MAGTIEWVAVKRFAPEPIGAIGFIGKNAVAIIAFYEDADANKDGKVQFSEWVGSKILFNLNGINITEVAMQARVEKDIILRDSSFAQDAAKLFLNFASGLIAQGVYQVYFARGVGMAGSALATRITSDMVKQFAVRKGFEEAVRKAFMGMAGV